MKKIIVITFFVVFISAPAFPAAFGFYGTGGYGRVDMTELDEDTRDYDYRVKYSTDSALYGGGITIETGDSSNSFHNRLNLGLAGLTSWGGQYDYRYLLRASIDNIFTIRIAESERMRFWIGPLIGFHLITGLTSSTRSKEWSDEKIAEYNVTFSTPTPASMYYLYIDEVWARTYGIFIPIGIATGLNIKLGQSAAITVEAGFRCGLYYLQDTGFNYEGYASVGFLFGTI